MPNYDEEDLLDEVASISPLSALDPEAVDRLTARQRSFLLVFINTGSLSMARKQTDVSLSLWRKWQVDEQFSRVFEIVKSPPAFAYNLAQAIAFKAMLEHFKLLSDERVQVRQWAIERAYSLNPSNGGGGSKRELEKPPLSLEEVKQLTAKLDDESKALINKSPFQFVDAEFREVPIDVESGDSAGSGSTVLEVPTSA